MNLRAMFQRFMQTTEACREGRQAAYKHRDLLTAWRRISPRYLAFFLYELADATENQRTKDKFYKIANAADNLSDAREYGDTPDSSDVQTVKQARSMATYRIARREFIKVMKRDQQ